MAAENAGRSSDELLRRSLTTTVITFRANRSGLNYTLWRLGVDAIVHPTLKTVLVVLFGNNPGRNPHERGGVTYYLNRRGRNQTRG